MDSHLSLTNLFLCSLKPNALGHTATVTCKGGHLVAHPDIAQALAGLYLVQGIKIAFQDRFCCEVLPYSLEYIDKHRNFSNGGDDF